MKRIYLDNAATTRVDPVVLETMLPLLGEHYGNASSIHHFGLHAKGVLEEMRQRLAATLHLERAEVVFTSGGTESNNLAIFGIAAQHGKPGHLITTAIEHPSVLNAMKWLAKQGWAVTFLPVDRDGRTAPADLARAIRSDTRLISVMYANNETGVVQPIAELAGIAAEHDIPFHTDAVQAFGKIAIDWRAQPITMLSIAGHKIYGPKGVGALFVQRGCKLSAQMVGGGQEHHIRAGTENVAAIACLTRAAELVTEPAHLSDGPAVRLGEAFSRFMADDFPEASLNGSAKHRVPGIFNYSFPGFESTGLTMALDLKGIAVSNGSACSAGKVEPSHVLRAMHLSPARQQSALRFSFGRFNSSEDLARLQQALRETVRRR